MAKIIAASLNRLVLPLHTPYKLSYRTFEEFEPYLVTLTDDRGRSGYSDAHISPGSSSETRAGGWHFLAALMPRLIGRTTTDAKAEVLAASEASKVAATALATAIEVLERSTLLDISADTPLPLLAPTSATTREAIASEVDRRLEEGYRCLKIKVGKDAEADLARVRHYQTAIAGRGTLRLDANRAFTRAEGEWFAANLAPDAIELFEQPCAAEDWDANAAVAAASTVPLMLDEPICTLDDIDRAAEIDGVGYLKLKLKRFCSLERLAEGLDRVRAAGMEPVLGDGLGSDLHNWLEAAVARGRIASAGEFNGFLKCHDRLLARPPRFADGTMWLEAGSLPPLDAATVARLTREEIRFGDTDRAGEA